MTHTFKNGAKSERWKMRANKLVSANHFPLAKSKFTSLVFFSLRPGGTQTISVDKKGMIGDMSDNKKTLPCRPHFEGRGTPRILDRGRFYRVYHDLDITFLKMLYEYFWVTFEHF